MKEIQVVKPAKKQRSRRMSILLEPAIYESAKKKCDELDISVNEAINQLLGKWSESYHQKTKDVPRTGRKE